MNLRRIVERLQTPADMRKIDALERQRAEVARVLGLEALTRATPDITTFDPYTPGAEADIILFPIDRLESTSTVQVQTR